MLSSLVAGSKPTHNRIATNDLRSTIHIPQDNASPFLTCVNEELLRKQDLQASILMPQLIGELFSIGFYISVSSFSFPNFKISIVTQLSRVTRFIRITRCKRTLVKHFQYSTITKCKANSCRRKPTKDSNSDSNATGGAAKQSLRRYLDVCYHCTINTRLQPLRA